MEPAVNLYETNGAYTLYNLRASWTLKDEITVETRGDRVIISGIVRSRKDRREEAFYAQRDTAKVLYPDDCVAARSRPRAGLGKTRERHAQSHASSNKSDQEQDDSRHRLTALRFQRGVTNRLKRPICPTGRVSRFTNLLAGTAGLPAGSSSGDISMAGSPFVRLAQRQRQRQHRARLLTAHALKRTVEMLLPCL